MSDLRLDIRTEAELEFYFCASESAQGIRSSYESMVNAPPTRFPARLDHWTSTVYVHGARPTGRPADVDERELEAADRARHVEHALRQLSAAQVRTLRLYFTVPAGKRHPEWGRLTWVVPESPVAHRAWVEHNRCRRPLLVWLARLSDRTLLGAIRRDAEALVHSAARAYEGARVRRRAA